MTEVSLVRRSITPRSRERQEIPHHNYDGMQELARVPFEVAPGGQASSAAAIVAACIRALLKRFSIIITMESFVTGH